MAEYKYAAATSIVKLMGKYTNPLPSVIVSTAISGGSISEAISKYNLSGLYSNAMRYYSYGATYYPRGVPTGLIHNVNVNAAAVAEIINNEVGHKIEIIYIHRDNRFENHYVSVYLQNVRGMAYDSTAITINPNGVTGTLTYATYAYDEANRIINILYNKAGQTTPVTEVVNYPYIYNIAYQVMYRPLNDDLTPVLNASPVYWIYIEEAPAYPLPGEEPIPDLPLIPDSIPTAIEDSTYFPIIPFYEDHTRLCTAELASAAVAAAESGAALSDDLKLYVASVKMMKTLGLSFTDLAAELDEGPGQNLNGQDQGIYAYFQFSADVTAGATYTRIADLPLPGVIVPPPTMEELEVSYKLIKPHQATMYYLYEFFLAEMGNSQYSKSDFEAAYKYGMYKRAPRHNTLEVTDETYQYVLSYYYITVTEKVGTITPMGAGHYVTEVMQGQVAVHTAKYETMGVNTTSLFIRKATSMDTYIEIEVCGLVQQFRVYSNTWTTTYVEDIFDTTKTASFITIPLNYGITKNAPVRYRNELLHQSMHMVFNSYSKHRVAWYETGVFRGVLTIIAIVLSPYTGGQSLTLLAVLETVAYLIVVNLVFKYILAPVFKWIAQELGVEAAAILAVIMTVAALFTGNVDLAQKLLMASRYVFKGVDLQLKQEMEDLQEDYAKLKSEEELLQKELDRAQGLLDNTMMFDPMTMVTERSNVVWGESADAFITGRLQLPALSLAIIQTPSIFTEMMLRLPSINETLNMR